MKIAITGGIGSGKSTLLSMVKQAGYPAFSADEISREVIQNPETVQKIAALDPAAVKDGEVDRKTLAAAVFGDEQKVKALNAVMHPAIMAGLHRRMEEAQKRAREAGRPPLVFAEVPLLFEGGFEKDFDRVFVVERGEESRIRAAALRDGVTESEIRARAKNQINYAKRDFSAHTVIKNDGTAEDLRRALSVEIEKILQNF